MRRWSQTKREEIEDLRIDRFIEAVITVCQEHGFSISHEDGHGAFVIEPFLNLNVQWLRGAHDGIPEEKVTHVVNRRRERFDVYIGRPSPWGNPFSHQPGTLAKFQVANRDEAIARFREWFLAQPELVARAKRELKGKVLGCWCKPASCHGDVIAEVVNEAK